MGERIKFLSKGKLFGNKFEIELNAPTFVGQPNQIHIQNNKNRIEIDQNDYLVYAFTVLVAEKNLKNLKGIK
ncbi:MAG: hypothetical protein PHP82_03395 [Candidatus ainarchaeum sp.]|nr:hypothetical protein [Candidatus ainarchaeum sp.]